MSTPRRLGDRYELKGVLGTGGMAEVRDGWDIRLDRAVAIKLLHDNVRGVADGQLRFHDEARAAAGLSHPNIVAVHDYGEHDGMSYIVMERLPGLTLADEIAVSPLPSSRVRAVMDEVLSALGVAHAAGVLHRDVKPGNILLTSQGHSKVADFGIAKTSGINHTQTGQIVGTLAYLSPDRLMGRPASIADDLYAVGCVGHEALCGRRAFQADNVGALTRSILDDTPPPLHAIRNDVDPTLAAVIERAMSRDPRQRFTSAAAMRTALANPSPAQRPSTMALTVPPFTPPASAYIPLPAAGKPRRRATTWAAVSGIAVLLILAATLLVFNSPFDGDQPTTATPTTTAPTSTPPSISMASSSPTPTATTTTATSEESPGRGNDRGGGKDKSKDKHGG